MTVLVTGGSGFLGTNLTNRLRQREEDVVSLSSADADLCFPDSLSKFSHKQYERIYHVAAWIQGGDFSKDHPGEQWLINQQINTTVLRWWAQEQPQAKLISIGSSGAYPEDYELSEEYYLTGAPPAGLYTYGMTKRMLHIGQMSLAQQYGLKFITIVPSTLYGPHYRVDHRRMQFIFDLARKMLAAKHFGDDVVLWGDGHQQRELVYIEDFIDDLFLLEDRIDNEIVNIGANSHLTIRQFADILSQEIGISPDVIQYDTGRYVGSEKKYLSTQKEQRLLGELKRTPLAVGIAEMMRTFEAGFLAYEMSRRGSLVNC